MKTGEEETTREKCNLLRLPLAIKYSAYVHKKLKSAWVDESDGKETKKYRMNTCLLRKLKIIQVGFLTHVACEMNSVAS